MTIYRRGRPQKYNALTGEGNRPPNVVGEYRIRYSKWRRMKYIGITNDLERRMREHEKSGKINDHAPYFEWMAALPGTPYKMVREHEEESYRKHNPRTNKRHGGGGREPSVLNYYEESSKPIEQELEEAGFVEFTDSKGKEQYGITGDRFYLKTIRFIISRIIRTILKLIILVVLAAVVLNYFGYLDVVGLVEKLPDSWLTEVLIKILTYLPKAANIQY